MMKFQGSTRIWSQTFWMFSPENSRPSRQAIMHARAANNRRSKGVMRTLSSKLPAHAHFEFGLTAADMSASVVSAESLMDPCVFRIHPCFPGNTHTPMFPHVPRFTPMYPYRPQQSPLRLPYYPYKDQYAPVDPANPYVLPSARRHPLHVQSQTPRIRCPQESRRSAVRCRCAR